MKTLFYLKDNKKKATEPNSIVLRYYLQSSKKYKVSGLKITGVSKNQWNQEEQKVKRSNGSYSLYNRRLTTIYDEIEKLEQSKGNTNITPLDIDNVVKASILNIKVEDVINDKDLLMNIIDDKIEAMKKDVTISDGNIVNYKVLKNQIEKYNKKYKIDLSINYLNNNLHTFTTNYIDMRRGEGIGDKTIISQLKKFNATINWYNLVNQKNIKPIKLSAIRWIKYDSENVYLTKHEISIFYQFAFGTNDKFDHIARPTEDMIYIKKFLYRCFSGMRVGDMNVNNINVEALDMITNKGYTYFQNKGDKVVTIPFINTYLLDIASDLNFDFPVYEKEYQLKEYAKKESDIIQYYYNQLIEKPRTFKVTTNKGIEYKPITDKLTSHCARRSYARLIYDSTNNIYFCSKMLGHSSIAVTEIYLGLNLEAEFHKYEKIKIDL